MITQNRGTIAFAVCGSFCTLEAALQSARALTAQGWQLLPVMSFAARLVYAAPEEPGEAADPGYCRWLNGLGLTETRILPHYQFIREHILDGQRMEDIALADSRKRHFLALPDGSYLMCSDGHEALYGKAWYFADGTLEEINEDEDVLPLR